MDRGAAARVGRRRRAQTALHARRYRRSHCLPRLRRRHGDRPDHRRRRRLDAVASQPRSPDEPPGTSSRGRHPGCSPRMSLRSCGLRMRGTHMTISVGMGIAAFPFADARGFWQWVDLCEAGGVDSIWQSDRVISTAPALECMSVMAALAGRTRRLKFGMNVLSLAQRDPVLVAKQCATIDVLSEGRLLPAFGIGSPLGPEWKALGIDTRSRGKRMDEGLEIVSRLWREDAVDFDGVHFKLKGASIAPKPAQAELPMWIGGSSEAAIRRTARYGTGWQAGPETPAEAGRVVAAIRAATAAMA